MEIVMRKLSIAGILILMLSSTAVMADTVTGTAGAGWQTWNAAALNQNGTPYWDGLSLDGANKNIGYCMSGTGSCGMPGAPGYIDYWGNATGTADLSFSFTPTGGDVASLKIEIAGFANVNQFGYKDSTGNHILFTGPQGAGAVASFSAVGNYVFFIISGNGQTYYTNSALNPSGDQNFQHFALFNAGSGTFYIGAEDLPGTSSDKDYNDLVVKVSQADSPLLLPEPSSLALLATGLLGFAGTARRRISAARPGRRTAL
jgi:hypothetical protein